MATYYAAVGGSSGNPGTEGSPWTFDYGLTQIVAGDTLYVKAGNHGNISRTIVRNGTSTNKIKVIGYKTSIGDISATKGSTFLSNKTLADSAQMPVYDSGRTSNRPNVENGIIIQGDYWEISNIGTIGYFRPFELNGDNNIIDNFFSSRSGSHNPDDQVGGFGSSFPNGVYSGHGMTMKGDNLILKNSYVLDAGAEGFRFESINNALGYDNTMYVRLGKGTYQFNKTAWDGNPVDYHFHLSSNCTNSTFYDTTVIQEPGMGTTGHGIVCKPSQDQVVTNIVFDRFYVENTALETQFPTVDGIVFKNGTVISTEGTGFDQVRNVGANIANASQNVTIENVQFLNGANCRSSGWNEFIWTDTYFDASVNLLVKNCYFQKRLTNDHSGNIFALAVEYGPGAEGGWTTRGMTLDHCTFDGHDVLFRLESPSDGIDFVNCIVKDISIYTKIYYLNGTNGRNGPYSIVTNWDTCNFSGGISRTGTNVTTLSPALDVDFITTNATLLTGGVATSDYAAGLPVGYLGEIDTPVIPPILDNLFGRKQNAIALINN